MKKITLFVMILLITTINAQQQQYTSKQNAVNHRETGRKHFRPVENTRNAQVTYFSENFESGDLGNWTTVDQDGDTYTWDVFQLTAHSGDYCASSASWTSTDGALTPDNWLITPAIDLSGASGTIFLEWYVAAQDQTWPSEVYRVLVSTTGTSVGDFVEIYPDETVQAGGPDGNNYWKRTVDVSAYAGQSNVYFAFQHHNVTDMFMINIDDVSVYQNTVIDGGLISIDAPNNQTGCSLSNAEDVTVTLYNYGGVNITDFSVSYSIDGGTPVIENVTGVDIAPATSYTYTFNQQADLSALGYHTVTANLNLANDSNGTNNNIGVNVTNGDASLVIEVQTDNNGQQSWELTDSSGNVIASHGSYQWNITETTTVCLLDNDCYTFNWNSVAGSSNTVTLTYNGVQVDQHVADGSYSVYAIGGSCAAVDAKLLSLDIPGYAFPNTDVNIGGTIRNVGSSPITSFDVDYSVNGGASVGPYSVTGVNLNTGDTYDFVHNVPFNQSVEGIYTIEVSISNVNGTTDGNPGDNVMSTDINISSSQLERTVLIEQFTTEQCPNCPPVLQYLENIFDNDPNVIMMAHHAGYYTDFLTTPEASDMTQFFNMGGSTYAPAGMMDRAYDGGDHDQDGTPEPGPVFWDGDPFGQNRIDERKAIPAFVSINICGNYNPSTRELNVRLQGEFMNNFSNVGVSLWVTEDHIAQQNQASAPAGFEHRFVERDAISSLLGDPITSSTNLGDSFDIDYTYTMDAGWNYDNLYLVAFVSKINDNDVNDREIANAVQIKLSDLAECSTGIDKLINDKIKVYPNPSTGSFTFNNVDNMSVKIYNIQGMEVYSNDNLGHVLQVNLSNLPNGTYFAKFTDNDKVGVKRIIIAK